MNLKTVLSSLIALGILSLHIPLAISEERVDSSTTEGNFTAPKFILKKQFFSVQLLKGMEELKPPFQGMRNTKSKGKAFFLSFLLPGAGEYYAGSKGMARNFFISEILLWAGYFSLRTYGGWLRDDYQVFAAAHADVDVSGKSHGYFVDIGNYPNIYEYNQTKRRQRNLDDVYPEDSFYYWEWDSEANRGRFENLRIASDRAFNRSLFVIGGILANHLISGIDAVRVARNYNEKIKKPSYGFQLQIGSLVTKITFSVFF